MLFIAFLQVAMSAPPLGILYALPRRFSTASCPPLPPPTKGKDAERVRKTRQGVKRTPSGVKKQGGNGLKKQGQRSEKPGVRKTGVRGLQKHAGVKKNKNMVRGQKNIGPI